MQYSTLQATIRHAERSRRAQAWALGRWGMLQAGRGSARGAGEGVRGARRAQRTGVGAAGHSGRRGVGAQGRAGRADGRTESAGDGRLGSTGAQAGAHRLGQLGARAPGLVFNLVFRLGIFPESLNEHCSL